MSRSAAGHGSLPARLRNVNATKRAAQISTAPSVRPFDLRPSCEADYAYAERLYVETMKPLLSRLEAWDEDDVLAKFRSSYRLEQVRIITVDGRDVGFLQVDEDDSEISLAQIHIEAPYRSRGIGTALIEDLLSAARVGSKPVSLSVVKHNPAQALYERLGFRVVGGDDVKFHMRWPAASA
jgi:ribosomal protein S18 acetylase RimI-like enzyme